MYRGLRLGVGGACYRGDGRAGCIPSSTPWVHSGEGHNTGGRHGTGISGGGSRRAGGSQTGF